MLSAFGFVRYLAAIHIVLFHCYRKDHTFYFGFEAVWWQWGYCWVTFFFILSGFCLTYTRYIHPGPGDETRLAAWRKGLTRIYPPYLISIALGIASFQAFDSEFKNWRSIPATLLLIQSWGPQYSCTEKSWVCVSGGINEPAWFVS